MPSNRYTHVPVTKSLREELRREADENGLTYSGVIRKLQRASESPLSKSDTDTLIKHFSRSVAEEVGTTPDEIEQAVRDRIPEDHR